MTLIEVMLSLGILLIVLSAFTNVLQSGLRSFSESRARQAASQVATESIEALRNVSPSGIRLDTDLVDLDALSNCTTGGGDLGYDPDGDGAIGCEELAADSSGAITASPPFAGSADAVTYVTIATFADDADVPDGAIRVTVQSNYDLPGSSAEIHRQALFSEVSRG